MFRGVNPLTLDNKSRLAVPAKYRERLQEACGGQLVLTIDRDRCLLIYPLPAWEEVERKLALLSSTNRQARGLKRLLLGHAEDCSMDGQGRLLIPAPLKEFAHLDRQVVLVGQGNKFELWDEPTWHQLRDRWLAEIEHDSELPADLESLSF